MDDDKRRRLRAAFRRAMDNAPNSAGRLVAFLLFPFMAANLEEEERERVKCEQHGASSRPWVVCTHVCDGEPVRVFQRFARGGIAGEVLCKRCNRNLDDAHPEALRFACELCVLARWSN
jgi:hypothetical protein